MNVKFHKNCKNTGKILKISCVRCNFPKIHWQLKLLNFLMAMDSVLMWFDFITCEVQTWHQIGRRKQKKSC